MDIQKQSPRDMSRKGQPSHSGQQATRGTDLPPGGTMATPTKGTPPDHVGNK